MDWRVDEGARCPRSNRPCNQVHCVSISFLYSYSALSFSLTLGLFLRLRNYRSHTSDKNTTAAYSGNSKKAMHLSVRDSLKKLDTDYIDILYLHCESPALQASLPVRN